MKKAWGLRKHSTNYPYPSQSLARSHNPQPVSTGLYVTGQTPCKELYTHDLISSSQQPYGVRYFRTPFPEKEIENQRVILPQVIRPSERNFLTHFTLLLSNFLQRRVLFCFWFLNSYLDIKPHSISNSIHHWIPWHLRSHSFRCLATILYLTAKLCQYSYTMKKIWVYW